MDGVHGVVSKEFRLSENPPAGQWSISAHINVSVTRFRRSHGNQDGSSSRSSQTRFCFSSQDVATEKHFNVAKDGGLPWADLRPLRTALESLAFAV